MRGIMPTSFRTPCVYYYEAFTVNMYYVIINAYTPQPTMTYTILDPATSYPFTAFTTNFPTLVDPDLDLVYTVCGSATGAPLSTLEASFFVNNPVTTNALTI